MSDEGMSDAEFDAKVGFPVGERYVPKSKLDAAEARATAAERERDALQKLLNAVQSSVCYLSCEHGWPPFERDVAHSDLCNELRAALTANHSAPVVEG